MNSSASSIAARVSLVLCLAAAPGARGDEEAAEASGGLGATASSEDELRELRERVRRLEERLAGSDDAGGLEGAGEEDVGGGAASESSDARFDPFWSRQALDTAAPLRGIYDRPFLAGLWNRAFVGGYTELEFHTFEDGVQSIPEGFRMHRTNLFLFTDLSDTVRFGSELEFETEFDGFSASSDIEVAVEMAFVDWKIFEELVLRGGAILSPLGRINVNHDGPVRELTERPLVSTYIIPSTLTEAGAGAWGEFRPATGLALTYEAYAVNGFSVLAADGSLAAPVTRRESILRESRTSIGGDDNDGVATTGRFGVVVDDALRAGASWHFGTYDERGDNFLSIFAGDVAWVGSAGPVELTFEGEVAVADFQRDAFATTAGVPDVFWGYWVQGGVGGMPAGLVRAAPFIFGGEGARLGAVLRWEWVDLDGDRGEVIEPGLTFRPFADTVFKFSYRITPTSFGLRGVPGTETFDDEGFVFSLSTYF